jgi:hypothetical protein
MRRVSWASIAIFVLAGTAGAQVNSRYSLSKAISLASLDSSLAPNVKAVGDAPSVPSVSYSIANPGSSPASVADPDPDPVPPPQGVYGVLPKGDREVSAGYTYARFYEVPGTTENANGGYVSAVYYLKPWIGVEGEIFAAFGTLSGSSSHLIVGAVGPRLRWQRSGRLELWGHALAGASNLSPQTPYGGTTAFAYEAGGGVDVNIGRGRWAYRVEGNVLGTQYFSTYQIGPKASVGIVYKF